jgi:tRNA A37 threonylcarbamoyltransferase TsaD
MYACLEKACLTAGALAGATGKPLFGINHMASTVSPCALVITGHDV